MTTSHLILTESDHQRLEILVARMLAESREANAHLQLLQVNLKAATVVASEDVPPDVVTMNSRVTVYDDDWDVTETCALVYPDAASVFDHRLSVLNPMGMSMLGRRSGDKAQWENAHGVHTLHLREVVYQPERERALELY